ncbi:aspartate aminotransferase family protein [Tanticharoenia sakaeratensis]|uniref:Beta alanine--pyruvate transaminase n=1 Tax=Tanticharoenia sakaeratensis NBRC 103193 TaxID=1231623 RepID=A0A0D6MKR0_9PROT|nr:aspartate aminotransferase family protein [Tanticharoenia sakaeratensis]GAN53853.1 beta alanine--pyruvate transaminase [Tanticharoenia sakaeratensis NBRC 103193]GBQ25084.1 beta alanine--pyruvate transaminase [Tanticharoenia sakaeratensis NBRC 103193]
MSSFSNTNHDAFWMPFSANRQFRADPRMLVSAKGMYYRDDAGHDVLDGCAGLWCVNAGHSRPRIVEAVQKTVATLDFAPAFQMGHPMAFEAADRLAKLAPGSLNHVMFCNSGSEAADTALKIAIAYHRLRGEGARTRLIGRERGYHGVGFGGISVGGISGNRKLYGSLLTGTDHLPHTLDLRRNAFTRGLPEHGAELADALERIVTLHDASTIAAVIVEPMAGSTGVLPPPVGYLKRLRDICTKHGILLIFDEVITGFGRLGGPAFAAEKYGVIPDIMTCAKGLTNGTVPMGAAIVSDHVFEAFMQGPETAIDLPHGYTYTAHPIACAAAIATLDTYAEEHLFERAEILSPYFEEAAHALRDCPHVVDIRNVGLVAGIELEPRNAPTTRAYEVFDRAFRKGVLLRYTGDILAISPPLIIEKHEIDRIFETIASILREVA